jgi:hypothetical protein
MLLFQISAPVPKDPRREEPESMGYDALWRLLQAMKRDAISVSKPVVWEYATRLSWIVGNASIHLSADSPAPSPVRDDINLLIDIAKVDRNPNVQVMVCAAVLNATQHSPVFGQVQNKISEIGNEARNPNLLKQATDYARANPMRNRPADW